MKTLTVYGPASMIDILVDDEDYEKVVLIKPYMRRDGRIHCRYKGLDISLGTFLIGRKDGLVVDHDNRKKYDNQKHNLRHITQAQNVQNGSKRIDNKSGYKGVSYNKRDACYNAELLHNGVRYRKGTCRTREEAAYTYNLFVAKSGSLSPLNELPRIPLRLSSSPKLSAEITAII